jgi:segregation and condensation protein B
MTLTTEAGLVEAIIFLEVDPVDLQALVRISGLSRNVVLTALTQIRDRFAEDHHGLELTELADGYTFTPKPQLAETLKQRYGRRNDARLSRAAMETLSIIAYSQPITRAEIENLRGVNPDGMMRLLISRGLVREVGRKDSPGKPVQYGTTREFLRLFRLSSIADLPKLSEADERRFAREE